MKGSRAFIVGAWVVGLAVLGLVALAAPAEAKTTAKATIRGVKHEFVVPDGWASRPGDDGIEFIPPDAKIHGPMTVAIVGVAKEKTDDPVKIARTLADNDHKKKPYLTW